MSESLNNHGDRELMVTPAPLERIVFGGLSLSPRYRPTIDAARRHDTYRHNKRGMMAGSNTIWKPICVYSVGRPCQ